jgi:hypothetical protein
MAERARFYAGSLCGRKIGRDRARFRSQASAQGLHPRPNAPDFTPDRCASVKLGTLGLGFGHKLGPRGRSHGRTHPILTLDHCAGVKSGAIGLGFGHKLVPRGHTHGRWDLGTLAPVTIQCPRGHTHGRTRPILRRFDVQAKIGRDRARFRSKASAQGSHPWPNAPDFPPVRRVGVKSGAKGLGFGQKLVPRGHTHGRTRPIFRRIAVRA